MSDHISQKKILCLPRTADCPELPKGSLSQPHPPQMHQMKLITSPDVFINSFSKSNTSALSQGSNEIPPEGPSPYMTFINILSQIGDSDTFPPHVICKKNVSFSLFIQAALIMVLCKLKEIM